MAPLGGAEIYKALDAGADISYWSDVQDGTHCASQSEWRTPLQQSIQRFLRNTGSAPAVFRISSRKAGNLAEWRNWQTPTLSDGGPTDPPPATGCAATASVNQGTGGFVATVRVTAGSSPVGGVDGHRGAAVRGEHRELVGGDPQREHRHGRVHEPRPQRRDRRRAVRGVRVPGHRNRHGRDTELHRQVNARRGRPRELGRPRDQRQTRSYRSSIMTLSHAATKSRTNFSLASSLA